MRLTPERIKIILYHLPELKEGRWPEDVRPSYLERPLATRKYYTHAPYEDPCLLIAEVEIRLSCCNYYKHPDGLYAKIVYTGIESEESLARYLNCSIEDVRRSIGKALAYISNKYPKTHRDGRHISYKEYRQH